MRLSGVHQIARSIVIAAAFALAVVLGLAALDLVDIRWPWEDVTSTERAIGPVPEEPAAVVRIEPIDLDCRARIHARVPVHGTKEHRAFGQVYRTDRVSLLAVGDIDTCVEASRVSVSRNDTTDTSTIVVPADAIRFERPRVDADATLGSVRFDKGFIGKLTDAMPWVDDSEGLTAAGYAFAQNMVGSSSCMAAAYDETRLALLDAYERHGARIGYTGTVEVVIVGEPDFDQQPPSRLDDFAFTVGSDTACVVATDLDPTA